MSGFWSGRRVVVTGGEGFIGSTLTRMLLESGADVTVFAHYKPYGSYGLLAENLNDVRLLAGDVRDTGQVHDAVEGADTVFHLAALIGIPYSYEAPQSYVDTNIAGTQSVLEAARRHGVRRMVHTSTSEVYGTALTETINESHPLQPQSPYSASKIGADMLALSYFHSFGTPVSICRPFNTYGSGQSSRAVIPAVLQQLHAGTDTIAVGATTPTRDFTYVTDTAAGFLAIAESDTTIGKALNLGTGTDISIGDLIKLLVSVSGSSARIVTDEARMRPEDSEVMRLISDNTAVKSLTGWSPSVTLAEGIRLTSEWVKNHPDGQSTRYQR